MSLVYSSTSDPNYSRILSQKFSSLMIEYDLQYGRHERVIRLKFTKKKRSVIKLVCNFLPVWAKRKFRSPFVLVVDIQ